MLFRLAILLTLSMAHTSALESTNLFEGDLSAFNVQHQLIDDPEALSFIQQGLAHAIELYGRPRVPVRRVLLRYRRQGALTNLTDSRKGVFTIFMSRKPEEYAFYGQLAHEVAHLLNAQLYDPYAEGLSTLFSEKMLKRHGKDWSGWEDYYRTYEDPFYAATYFMMKEVSEIAGELALKSLLSHAKYDSKNSQVMHIDIDEWINTLPREKRAAVKNVILKYAPAVQRSMKTLKDSKYAFRLPA
jgi:hypothetical protein